jgi:hypothetical protein
MVYNSGQVAVHELINILQIYLRGPCITRSRLPWVLEQLKYNGWRAVFFGGLLRDLMEFGSSANPRDLDIVVDASSNDELYAFFKEIVVRRTRFGGLVIDLGPLRADLWCLRNTWAFGTGAFAQRSFVTLPKTTFLNVEAVAVEISGNGDPRVFDDGFFAAFGRREIDINFGTNPFPALCVVRSLITASSLHFALGNRLVDYIVRRSDHLAANEYVEAQLSHYGEILLPAERISNVIGMLKTGDQSCFLARTSDRPGSETHLLSTFNPGRCPPRSY